MSSLIVRDLSLHFGSRALVNDVHWTLAAGELLGLTGPSGSGKTLAACAALGLTRLPVTTGHLEIHDGDDVERWSLSGSPLELDLRLASIRGRQVSYLPQNADQCLDPLRPVGKQVRSSAGGPPEPWLAQAGFTNPAAVLDMLPHTLSGGMARRVAIAMALARGSGFLLLDEPTTGLDPVTADRVAATLRDIADRGVGVLWISHDLDRLCALADRSIVLSAGRIDEVLDRSALRTRMPKRPVATALLAVSGGSW